MGSRRESAPAQRVKWLRWEHGLSAEEVDSELGYGRDTWLSYESGDASPSSAEEVCRMAKFFGRHRAIELYCFGFHAEAEQLQKGGAAPDEDAWVEAGDEDRAEVRKLRGAGQTPSSCDCGAPLGWASRSHYSMETFHCSRCGAVWDAHFDPRGDRVGVTLRAVPSATASPGP